MVGFPHGANLARSKADEAAAVVAHGAAEVDVVVALGAIADGDLAHVAHELAEVRERSARRSCSRRSSSPRCGPPAVLRGVCEAAVDGGADYVKTSTGFHPAGGATVEAVATMRAAVGSRARVKASGRHAHASRTARR